MSDEPPTGDPFLIEHVGHVRAELMQVVANYLVLERVALFTTAFIWTALAATTSADWDPLIKWLPLVLNALFALRAIALVLRVGTLERYLVDAERHFAVPPALALETRHGARRVGAITSLLFWGLLLAATAGLPYFYIEQATEPDYQNDPSMTYQAPHTSAVGALAALPPRSER
jgi:hypothetical protein